MNYIGIGRHKQYSVGMATIRMIAAILRCDIYIIQAEKEEIH